MISPETIYLVKGILTKAVPDFGRITNPLGIGSNQNSARDNLNIHLYSFAHKGYLTSENQFLQWGLSAELQTIQDQLHEWIYEDSAGYSFLINQVL